MFKHTLYRLDFNQYLSHDYQALDQAAKKITGNNELSSDLLHYAIEEMSYKDNLQAIIDSGGARFYLVRIMMTQWRSQTGPFYKQFIKQEQEIDIIENKSPEEDKILDINRVEKILNELPWYDRELWKLYVESGLNYSKLSKETGIPRTSIGLTLNRVRKHIKQKL